MYVRAERHQLAIDDHRGGEHVIDKCSRRMPADLTSSCWLRPASAAP
jgi:hypothetical protein